MSFALAEALSVAGAAKMFLTLKTAASTAINRHARNFSTLTMFIGSPKPLDSAAWPGPVAAFFSIVRRSYFSMKYSEYYDEIRALFRRKFVLLSLFGIYAGVNILGCILAQAWARSRITTIIDLLEIHRGYEGLAIGYSGFGSLLINLVEKRGTLFVDSLSITQDQKVFQRFFTPASTLSYPGFWPFRLAVDTTTSNSRIQMDVVLNSWILIAISILALMATTALLLLLTWLQALNRRHLEYTIAEQLAAYAQQVAHDIRSPLAALQSLLGRLDALPPVERSLVESAIHRIRSIADDLLDRGRGAPARLAAPLAEAIGRVVNEKAAHGSDGLTLQWVPDRRSRELVAAVVATDFERILSNLLDNSIQALTGRGTIWIEVAIATSTSVVVTVSDNGPGIHPDILPKLGRRGATFGKHHGNGLGLYYAKQKLESWGGGLTVASDLGRGTTVSMMLPLVSRTDEPPASIAPIAALVDDDPLVRKTWALAADRRGRRLSAFASAAEFLAAADEFDRATPVYIDADLGDGENGIDASRRIHALGFREIWIATGHPASSFPAGLTHLRGIVGKEPPWSAV